MVSERYRWKLVDDFVENFNSHRISKLIPSELICVDESMIQWYGLSGQWIKCGLPYYLAIDRKPDKGCDIQTACCGRSGVMLQLRFVKTTKELDDLQRQQPTDDEEQQLQHGTHICVELVKAYHHTQRLVCADLFFASMRTAETTYNMGLRFNGIVKSATRRFPMQFLLEFELHQRGDRKGLVCYDTNDIPKYMAFVFVNCDSRYFIATAGSLANGATISRMRWHQVAKVTTNLDPELIGSSASSM
jgi:Transposase IS4